jgi:hypothetical protein
VDVRQLRGPTQQPIGGSAPPKILAPPLLPSL